MDTKARDVIEVLQEIRELKADKAELLTALKALAADVEKVARSSYTVRDSPETFEADFEEYAPDEYALWKQAMAAIAKVEGR